MAGYYEIPSDYVLAPNPRFHLLSLNHVTLFTADLRSHVVNCVIADPRSDKLKLIMRRGEGGIDESVTLLCAPEVDNIIVPPESGLNLLTEAHRRLYKRNCESKALSIVFLSEDHHARENLGVNFNTYIKLLRPDVVVVSEGVFATGLHEKLLDIYSRYCRAQLVNDGTNVFWLYHNPANVVLNVAMEHSFGFVSIERVVPLAETLHVVEPGTENV